MGMKKMHKNRVLFVTNLPSPYRVRFFNMLSPFIDLTVAYLFEKGEHNRTWSIDDLEHTYAYEILPEIVVSDKIRFNPSWHRFLRNHDFDVYIVGNYTSIGEITAMRYAKKIHKPLIINSDGGFILPNESRFKRAMKKRLLAMGDHHIVSGQNAKKTLLYYGVEPTKIDTYPFSSIVEQEIIDRPFTDTEKQRARYKIGIPSGRSVALFVGQFIARKNIEHLLHTALAARNKRLQFVLVGQGPLRREYETFIASHNLDNVTIAGYKEKELLQSYYKAADVLLLLSKSDTWGLVLNEAIANGLPVIVSQYIGAAYDLVKDGENGYMIDIDKDDYDATYKLIVSTVHTRAMAASSLEIAHKYTIEKQVDAHRNIIQSVCDSYRDTL